MDIINWIDKHFMVISLVWFPAFLGYLNAFVASCKVMGWDKLAVELGKIEDALKVRQESGDSKNQDKFSNTIVALLRKQFGGHEITKK